MPDLAVTCLPNDFVPGHPGLSVSDVPVTDAFKELNDLALKLCGQLDLVLYFALTRLALGVCPVDGKDKISLVT